MIPLKRPTITGKEEAYLADYIAQKNTVSYNTLCTSWIEKEYNCKGIYLVASCTQALEMAAMISRIKPGDEVVMPSYTYVSTAGAVTRLGATPVFVDIKPDTMNIDETLIEAAVTEKTKAIIPVHHAGVPAEMDTIKKIADRYDLTIIEDAAYGFFSSYKNRYLGTLGDIGCISFDNSKSIQCSQGGAVFINKKSLIPYADTVYEIGTNRKAYFNGETEHYEWKSPGSKFRLSELNCAFLLAQLESSEEVFFDLKQKHALYISEIKASGLDDYVEIPEPFNGVFTRIFYIKVKRSDEREKLITHLKKSGIESAFSYVPLHLSAFGQKNSIFKGSDSTTVNESRKLLRLPFYYGIKESDVRKTVHSVSSFFKKER